MQNIARPIETTVAYCIYERSADDSYALFRAIGSLSLNRISAESRRDHSSSLCEITPCRATRRIAGKICYSVQAELILLACDKGSDDVTSRR